MSDYSQRLSARGRNIALIHELCDLVKRGYCIPWIDEKGIAPLARQVLEELVNLRAVPGSIECLRELENEHGLDHARIMEAAEEVLPQGESLQTFNFCKTAIKALENEILRSAPHDPARAEVLLGRYVACVLRERGCHIESINDLLTVLYNTDSMFCGNSGTHAVCLLNITKAWKSGLFCGLMEESCKIQEKFSGRAQALCSDLYAAIDKLSVLYSDIQSVRSSLSSSGDVCSQEDLKERAVHLQNLCGDLLGIISQAGAFNDTAHADGTNTDAA